MHKNKTDFLGRKPTDINTRSALPLQKNVCVCHDSEGRISQNTDGRTETQGDQFKKRPSVTDYSHSWPLQIGPTGCPETSVRNWHSMTHNTAGERGSQMEENDCQVDND